MTNLQLRIFTLLKAALLLMLPITLPAESLFGVDLDPKKHAILMRHAVAPGMGDPQNFDLKDCRTQRNLSSEGREQARKIGRYLKNTAYHFEVYSSQWCRCLDTARELKLSAVNPLAQLNSFFRHGDKDDHQTNATLAWLKLHPFKGMPVLVTHQVNITALTGVFPTSGEMILVDRTTKTLTVIERKLIDF